MKYKNVQTTKINNKNKKNNQGKKELDKSSLSA